MGSSFFGRPNIRGSSPSPISSSSSPATRRGKKNGSEKLKQPQRGLGVARDGCYITYIIPTRLHHERCIKLLSMLHLIVGLGP
ncbi:hypothetical protein DY000_02020194 [Brassica cretica]|uniref:Uncharacterized protein n=1 Tax=Brassica cretica TaxID=69181 RepID=A0ABQ7CJ37_BRACR|nr:hypothetical protein DY000_02010036 [Brassica cretica]KAF3595058.1 hypothetical protein DY000_02020194 [Brassica cretica]